MKTWHFSNFYFFYYATIGVLIPYWGLFLQYRGFDAQEIGQLMAVLLVSKVLAPNIWASIADRVVAKKGSALGIIKFATFATFIAYCTLYLANGFWSTALIMLSFCVFWNASLPQMEAATLNHLKDDKSQYGRVRLWGSIGFVVTVLVLGPLMDQLGPGVVLPAGAIAFFLVFLSSMSMRDIAVNQCENTRSEMATRSIFSQLNPRLVCLLLLCVFMQIGHAPWQSFFALYLEAYGYTKFTISLFYTIGVVFEIIVFIYGFALIKRFSLLNLLSFTFFVSAIRWCLLSQFPESTWMVVITQISHAVTFGLYHTVMIQLIHQNFVGRYQVRGQALYSSLTFGLGGAIGSFLSGYIWTDFSPSDLFLFAGVLMSLVFVFSLWFSARVGSKFN